MSIVSAHCFHKWSFLSSRYHDCIPQTDCVMSITYTVICLVCIYITVLNISINDPVTPQQRHIFDGNKAYVHSKSHLSNLTERCVWSVILSDSIRLCYLKDFDTTLRSLIICLHLHHDEDVFCTLGVSYGLNVGYMYATLEREEWDDLLLFRSRFLIFDRELSDNTAVLFDCERAQVIDNMIELLLCYIGTFYLELLVHNYLGSILLGDYQFG